MSARLNQIKKMALRSANQSASICTAVGVLHCRWFPIAVRLANGQMENRKRFVFTLDDAPISAVDWHRKYNGF